MHTVSIFPYFDAFNQSFFLYSLQAVFGAGNIGFTKKGFPTFQNSGSLKAIIAGDQVTRVFIDHWDLPVFDMEGLEWCDVYAKRNIDPLTIPTRFLDKIVPAGPSFPVRIGSLARTGSYALSSFWATSSGVLLKNPPGFHSTKEHFANWAAQYWHRLTPDAYQPSPSSGDYAFFCGSLWKKDAAANDARAYFMRACKSIPGLTFEGGFARRAGFEAHRDLMVDTWYSQEQYLKKTSTSAVVFNNPAVARCHSWRLGEALALGKAIVSLPIERLLPAPLVHGENVHIVEPTLHSVRDAVQRIAQDDVYRNKLEKGATAYYHRHLIPVRVVERIQGLDSSSFVTQLGVRLSS